MSDLGKHRYAYNLNTKLDHTGAMVYQRRTDLSPAVTPAVNRIHMFSLWFSSFFGAEFQGRGSAFDSDLQFAAYERMRITFDIKMQVRLDITQYSMHQYQQINKHIISGFYTLRNRYSHNHNISQFCNNNKTNRLKHTIASYRAKIKQICAQKQYIRFMSKQTITNQQGSIPTSKDRRQAHRMGGRGHRGHLCGSVGQLRRQLLLASLFQPGSMRLQFI